MATKITEEKGVHKQWYDEARDIKTPTQLADFATRLLGDYEHDYGTICHAAAALAIAGASVVEHDPQQGGLTGFQGSAVSWQFLQGWERWNPETFLGVRMLKYDDLLYPQYEFQFCTVPESVWTKVRARAEDLLKTRTDDEVAPRVRAHWESIALGHVPFGLEIAWED